MAGARAIVGLALTVFAATVAHAEEFGEVNHLVPNGMLAFGRTTREPPPALTRVHKLASAHVSPCEVAQAVIWPRPRRRTR